MPDPRIQEIVRHFPENGMKLLLEDSRNVRDLLRTSGEEVIHMIEFDTLEPVKATFIQPDYRHVAADVVLAGSLRDPAGDRPRELMIYILIEHQSEPDPRILLRVHDFFVRILKFQERRWRKAHASLEGFRFSPVLPVVFYTGARRWDSLGRLVDLIEPGKLFERFIPSIEPIFLNLPAMDAPWREAEGGYFGWVLRLVQERQSPPEQFRVLLGRVIAALEGMPPQERLRWLEFLSYIHALIYHVRAPSEGPDLRETIEVSVQTDQHRQELFDMGRTIAEELIAKGMKEGESRGMLRSRQQTLIRQLRKRFGEIPEEMIRTVETMRDTTRLDQWLDNVLTAQTLNDVGLASDQ